ncbi:MAG: hypothetical protein KAY37_00490, partial [Phycisphaerae bacterium]|nr:hypothetical protein [Phycisphaerae bacterium]
RDGQPWYKLQNPLTQRVEVYFQIEPNSPLDPRVILGKYVGIQGERRFDQKLGADVVRAKRIVVLTPDSPAATRPTRREP